MITLVQPTKLLIGLIVVSIGLAISGIATMSVRAQSPLDGFDPNINGIVRAIALQPNGKIIIGGDFTTVSPNSGAPVARNRVVRFNPDGTLDNAFSPNVNNAVYSIAVQGDGKILIGGSFTSVNGTTHNRIARLDAVTDALDTGFNPNPNGEVLTIALQEDGKILVGGNFNGANSISGATRNRIAR